MITNDANGFQPQLRFNGDTSSIYSQQTVSGNGSTTSSAYSRDLSTIGLLTPSGAGSNQVAAYIVDIIDYSSSKRKTVKSFSGLQGSLVCVSAGFWSSSSAIDSITILGSQNFSTTTRFALYGIK
jgi:hypothetical protein